MGRVCRVRTKNRSRPRCVRRTLRRQAPTDLAPMPERSTALGIAFCQRPMAATGLAHQQAQGLLPFTVFIPEQKFVPLGLPSG
jgi:hypothetical protein